MRRARAVWGMGCVVIVVALGGCGSRVDTATEAPTTRVAVPASSAPGGSTVKPTGATTTTTAGTPATTGGAPTSTTAAPGGDLADFCAKTKQLNLADVTAFEAYDANSAAKLVFTFDRIQKAAPAELADAFTDMRPLVEALNQKVKSGEVHDRDSLKAWLQGLNTTNQPALEQWVRGQAKVVPFITAHCS